MNNKFILDACCGGKMFWNNKNHPNVIYMDIRKSEKGHSLKPGHEVNPNIISDFKNIPFKDKTFKLVVFDPPHLFLGESSEVAKYYGRLNKSNWKTEIKKGFNECWRVLDDYGILIFKWNEFDIKKSDVLKLIEIEPLFGHTSNRSTKNTHWICFMKNLDDNNLFSIDDINDIFK